MKDYFKAVTTIIEEMCESELGSTVKFGAVEVTNECRDAIYTFTIGEITIKKEMKEVK